MDKRFTGTLADIESRRTALTERATNLEREWQGHEDNKTRAQAALRALGQVDSATADRVIQVAAAMGALNNDAIRSAAAAVAGQAKVPTDQVQKYVNFHLEAQTVIEAETSQKIIDEAWNEVVRELDALPEPPEEEENAASDVASGVSDSSADVVAVPNDASVGDHTDAGGV